MPKYKVTMEEDLERKPCPFCGAENLTVKHSKEKVCWYVHCESCQTDGPFDISSAHSGDAVKLWNRRS